MAVGLQEIRNGNNITDEEDEVNEFMVIVPDGTLTEEDDRNLHSEIRSRCSNSKKIKFQEIKIASAQHNELGKGNVVFLDDGLTEKGECKLLVR